LKNQIIYIFAFLMCFSLGVTSQAKNVLDSDWDDVVNGDCDDQNSKWWSSAEAIRIAENVLLYQKDIGGWPKNTPMHHILTQAQKDALIAAKPFNRDCTIDNSAVKLELTYLSKVHGAIPEGNFKTEIKTGFIKGIQYLLEAQYENGGWPQYYPLRGGYSNHITYNDNAMINVMTILKHIYEKDNEFSIVPEDSIVDAAGSAFDKGVECILNTQFMQNGLLTVWCAQHHYETLVPEMARSYELASLSGGESAGIIEFLTSIDNPSYEIRRAIYYSVNWYDDTRIIGYKVEDFVNEDGLDDIRVVEASNAPHMWARFYTLEDNTPFFCSRDGIKRYSLAEISYERRNNYVWYGDAGFDAFRAYTRWYPKWGSNTEQETVILLPVQDATYLPADTIPVKANANEYAFGCIEKFELFVDNELVNDFGSEKIDTFLTDISIGNHSIVVKSTDDQGYMTSDSSSIFVVSSSSIPMKNPVGEGVAQSFYLLQNYPNPFNPSTKISFSLSVSADVRLNIYNLKGERVRTLIDQYRSAGIYETSWNGCNDKNDRVASGIYIYRIEINTGKEIFSQVRQMLKLE